MRQRPTDPTSLQQAVRYAFRRLAQSIQNRLSKVVARTHLQAFNLTLCQASMELLNQALRCSVLTMLLDSNIISDFKGVSRRLGWLVAVATYKTQLRRSRLALYIPWLSESWTAHGRTADPQSHSDEQQFEVIRRYIYTIKLPSSHNQTLTRNATPGNPMLPPILKEGITI